MKLFPGNESEKPVIRKVIDDLKHRNSVTGRTIRIADKGLDCAENIAHALREGDGYIFSESVKQLPETEKTWVLLENDYKDIPDKNGKVKYRIKECVDDFPYTITDPSTGRKLQLNKILNYIIQERQLQIGLSFLIDNPVLSVDYDRNKGKS